MFRLLFWKNAITRADEVRKKHQAAIVCGYCGEGAIPGYKHGYLVRDGYSYRHSQPDVCAIVMTKKQAERLAKSNPLTRLWARVA